MLLKLNKLYFLYKKNIFILNLFLLLNFIQTKGQETKWHFLLQNNNLNEFVQLNGKANFTLVNGVLTGTSKLNTPNSFLATKTKYSNFILEFDVLIDNDLNSGVQFRSESLKNYLDGRVHGYQCEIETSSRKWAGGIYDEARRGWLYPLSRNKTGQEAFIRGSWNKYRIEAIGNSIKTFVNSVEVSNLFDDMTQEGFIAFQVHGISNPEQEGKQVRWKNIRILVTDLERNRMIALNKAPHISYLDGRLTQEEKRLGFRMLWDGKTTNGWQLFPENSQKCTRFVSCPWQC